MSSPASAQPPDTSLVSSTVVAEPESSTSNSSTNSSGSNNNNNNVATNNNNACKALPGKKDGKLPPCSSISNSSFLWDPDVDGEMVNMPLAPQLITEVPPGEELEDLTELIGPELATLVTATHDKSITIMQNMDVSACYNDMSAYNSENIDFGKVWGEYAAHDNQHNPGLAGGPGAGGLPNQTFRKVIIARKIGGGGAGGAAHPPPARTEDNNNNSDMMRSEFGGSGAGEAAGCKALLLQHRDIRSDSGQPGPGPANPNNVVNSKTASGESVTLTVVRGDPAAARGQDHITTVTPRVTRRSVLVTRDTSPATRGDVRV